MKDYCEFPKSALCSQLDHIKSEAMVMSRFSGAEYLMCLDRFADSTGFRSWRDLVHEAEHAKDARVSRFASLACAENDSIFNMDLSLLCKEHPEVALVDIDDLSMTLFEGILETLRSPLLFAERSANFGDISAYLDDKNFPGWRLDVNAPGGHLFHGQYPANGKMIALIDGSVPGDLINEYQCDHPELDEEQMISELRENYRGAGKICFYRQIPIGQDDNILKIAEACYLAILESIEDQCGVTLT